MRSVCLLVVVAALLFAGLNANARKTCKWIGASSGTDDWCNNNCNHNPPYCPATHCSCNTTCGCQEYRNGATANDAVTCSKNEGGILKCMPPNSGDGLCPGDHNKCAPVKVAQTVQNKCGCQEYRNGANATFKILCSKNEGGILKCMPPNSGDGLCPGDHTKCNATNGTTPAASPAKPLTTSLGCGPKPKFALFGNSSLKCKKGNDCLKTYCGCINATVGANFTCGMSVNKPNCSVAAKCIAARSACINKAADDAACTNLKDLKMSNLAVAGGQLYTQSNAFKACRYETCIALNKTAGNCTLNFRTLCASPVVFVGTLRLRGDFAKILNDPAQKAKFQTALEKDLANALGVAYVVIIRMYVAAKSRRQAQQTLIVEFNVPGVSAQNADFAKKLEAVKTGDSSWLKESLVTYKAIYGADASFTFAGISAGSASSAAFSTSASSAATTTSTSNSGSSTSQSGSSTASSGAATQSIMAAVIVAVVGAMLF